MPDVRVRIAPSPTGAIHLGLVRTALYNWLFARHHGGRFVLRIDDTDQQRNDPEVLRPILAGLRWLGIDWDEGPEVGGPHAPYFQSQRQEKYRAAVERMLAGGHAYYDYSKPEEYAAERDAAVREKRLWRYSRNWLAETAEQRQRFEAEGRRPVVRLKMPLEGRLMLPDLIRGNVEFDWQQEQDHVVQRADGSCLYHLANVVDDHDFGITHVIRAEEHLSNTPRQVFMCQALGYPSPAYAHLPVVAEPGSKSKLSKRKVKQYLKNPDFAGLVERGRKILGAIGQDRGDEHLNPVTLEFYARVGFLPQALVNYMALLGWSYDDRTEYFTLDALAERFTLEGVNRAAASFDPGKLMAFQVRYMMEMPVERKVELVLPYLLQAGVAGPNRAKVAAILAAAGDRVKVAGDVLDYLGFFVPDERLAYDEKAFDKAMDRPGARELLAGFGARLAGAAGWDAVALKASLGGFVESRGVRIGDVVHALRVALTGKAVGFGVFDIMAILGRESSLARIDRALQRRRGG
ncbi:glutamate--tRNA ligase [candidate division WOR-3 bacterium]|nr:glutamate--tRNA ligase [candidate division WOR-3 bacterium]